MKTRLLGALVGLAISFALPTFAQQKETIDPQLIEQIDAFDKKFAEAVNNNDAAAVAALYTENATFVTDRGPIYGRQAIEKWYAEVFKTWHPKNYIGATDPKSPRIIGTADNIAANGEWSMTLQGKNGESIPLKGYWAAIYVREGDDWKCRLDAYNVTSPPAATATTQQKETVDPQIIEKLNAISKKCDEAFNNNDAAALAANFTQDVIFVTDTAGPLYGRQALEKQFAEWFKGTHFSNHILKGDPNSFRVVGTADKIASTGEWSETLERPNGKPFQLKGHYLAICTLEGDAWKIWMSAYNRTPPPPAPAQTK